MDFGSFLFFACFVHNADSASQNNCSGVSYILAITACVFVLLLISIAVVAIVQSFIKLKNETKENAMRLLLDAVEKTGISEQSVEIIKSKNDKTEYTLKIDCKRGDAQ